MAYDYELLKVETEGRLAWVTVSNPPINLITLSLYAELVALSQELAADKDLTVVVMKSADPDFFLAHFDVSAILQFPIDEPATRETQLNDYHLMCERFRTMDKVTIAQIEGRVGGGGSELAASFDMRFGVAGKTRINQMEVPLGILPGGTGTQRLPVFRTHHHATARRQHHIIPECHLFDDLLLPVTKALLPLHIKDPGNVGTCALLDLGIGIGKLQLQVLGQVFANGRLAGPHGADQKNPVESGHLASGKP